MMYEYLVNNNRLRNIVVEYFTFSSLILTLPFVSKELYFPITKTDYQSFFKEEIVFLQV